MTTTETSTDWSADLVELFDQRDVRLLPTVPDAGFGDLFRDLVTKAGVTITACTTEEEGIAIAAGAWLGGVRSVVMMQSSGVGNCVNMLSLPVISRSPLVLFVTMRGEWAEFNPWQNPMGRATEACLRAVGVETARVEHLADIVPTMAQAMTMAYESDQQVAVLLSQRMLEEKVW